MRTQGDVEYAQNFALVAIKIRLQRNWNALSAILPHSLIRIQNCVSLNASLPATNTTLRPSRAVNALRTSLIQQEQRSASLATPIIAWIASILFSIRPFPNVSNVIVQRRWTINRWLADQSATQLLTTIISPINVINALPIRCIILLLKNALRAISQIVISVSLVAMPKFARPAILALKFIPQAGNVSKNARKTFISAILI